MTASGEPARQKELADRLKASGALDGIFEQIDAGQVPLVASRADVAIHDHCALMADLCGDGVGR